MHILLVVGKTAGIVILAVLALLILVLLCALFVPIRYRFQGRWEEEPSARASVSWLFRVVQLIVSYEKEHGPSFCLKLFGVRLFDSARETKKDRKKEKKRKRGREKPDPKAKNEPELTMQSLEPEKTVTESQDEEISQERNLSDQRARLVESEKAEETEGRKAPKREKKKRKWKPAFSFQSFRDKLKGIKDSFRRIKTSFLGIRDSLEEKKAWLQDEKNQASLKLLFGQGKKLLAHIWPKTGKGRVVFGFDDPYTTGQVLQAAALLYPFYVERIEVRPVFEEKVLKAEGNFGGRICAAYLLWLFWGIFKDKHTWNMIRSLLG